MNEELTDALEILKATTELREAVQILVKRMETHPKEFESSPLGKFYWVARMLDGLDPPGALLASLTNAEVQALQQGLSGVRYRRFHDRVMNTLLNEDEAEDPFMEQQMQVQGRSLKPGGYPITAAQAAVANKLGIPIDDYAKVLAIKHKAARGAP